MYTASSAIFTCFALRSASEYTATVLMPMRFAVLNTRQAISPRFATRIFLKGSSARRYALINRAIPSVAKLLAMRETYSHQRSAEYRLHCSFRQWNVQT